MFTCSRHQEALHNPSALTEIADRLSSAISVKAPNAERIIVCGMSGAIPAGIVSVISGLEIAIIRKDSDNFHGFSKMQGLESSSGNYVIIDDLIDSGNTMNRILRSMSCQSGKCLGIFLYEHESSRYVGKNMLFMEHGIVVYEYNDIDIPVWIVRGENQNV